MEPLSVLCALLAILAHVPCGYGHKWSDYKAAHGRLYVSAEEDARRQQIFQENVRKIEQHNARYAAGEVTWKMAVNRFADLTHEEFLSFHDKSLMERRNTSNREAVSSFKPDPGRKDYPESVDYRSAFGSIRDQKGCGCCYAMAAVGVVEAHYSLKHGKNVSLSVQQVVDCSSEDPSNNKGCTGGDIYRTYPYAKYSGLMLEQDYPFVYVSGTCRFNSSKVAVKVTSYMQVRNENKHLIAALAERGPVGLAVDAKEWQFYHGGIFHPTLPFMCPTHWRLRNSWSTTWGEDGYMRIARDVVAPQHVGINTKDQRADTPSYALVA